LLGRHAQTLILAAIVATLVAGCGSTRPSDTHRETPEEALRRHEADFHPADYDPEPGFRSDHPASAAVSTPAVTEAGQPAGSVETIQGFRVQVYSTPSIDEAKAKKAEIEAAFPAEWFYVQYDAPAYKVRAGNFLSRLEADRFARTLADRGFAGTWVVPDRILKNPPPHPTLPPADPDSPR
jgi:hypothetical protein